MAAEAEAIWAVDLGNSSLKALHLMAVGDVVQVIGFDQIQHSKILTSSGITPAERDELVALTLRQFVQRNDVGYDSMVVSVPSQSSFARFVTLPPVEAKRVPEIVRFEAAQQIPFDISEVQWDWQLMSEADASEKRVGLFAIKNEIVEAALEPFDREDLPVSYVQMAPMALYNYVLYDRPDLVNSESKAIVLLNVGAENSDLVVCTPSTVWQRCIMMGGNSFTNAIAETFKLNPEKAEKLKRTAAVSKYARQIFQAMRPVFADFAGEVQRSLSFFASSNPDVRPTRMVAMGGGTRLRGLCKYLQQTLQIPVERPDSFKRLAIAEGLSAAKFHENVTEFGVVYGLGLQGLDLGRIESNLLPSSVARSMAWANKLKYFIGAACMLLVVSLLCLGRTGLDTMSFAKNAQIRRSSERIIQRAEGQVRTASGHVAQRQQHVDRMKTYFDQFRRREAIPTVAEAILAALPNAANNPEQAKLHEAFAKGDVETILDTPRPERKQLFVTGMSVYFSDDLDRAQFGATAQMRKSDVMREAALDTLEDMEDYGEMMEADMELYGVDYIQQMYGPMMGQGQEEKKAGFVVQVYGYSPYKDIRELLDPVGVGNNKAQWGFVTRLMHMHVNEATPDVNGPLQLYDKTDPNHFKMDYGTVDLNGEFIPAGVGVFDILPMEQPGVAATTPVMGSASMQTPGINILVDPMTREIISAVPALDAQGQQKLDRLGNRIVTNHDQWFVVNFKLKWANAPASVAPANPMAAMMRGR